MVCSVTGPDLELPGLELRCPEPWGLCPAGRLLAKLRTAGQQPSYVHPDNLIELECPDCKVRMRRAGHPVRRVLHRYDFLGRLSRRSWWRRIRGARIPAGRGVCRYQGHEDSACA